jgi:hypothetical protein
MVCFHLDTSIDSLFNMNLTSQTALSTLTSPTKRKAQAFDDDAENIDPIIFFSPKKSKAADGSSKETPQKPVNYFLTAAPPSPDFSTACKPVTSPIRRPILAARAPAPKLNTTSLAKSPLSAPAGRSPTRKRIGILNRRRTASPFTRVDPPKFHTPGASNLGFSIDAALSGTIPSYKPRAPIAAPAAQEKALPIPVLYTPTPKESWNFEIYEDTEEELATNLMEHSTCTLDISSDEESRARGKDERGKENVPPLDDISQTRTQLSNPDPVIGGELSMASLKRAARRRREIDEGACDVDRSALGELAAEDFYADGCDGSSVFIVAAEEDAEPEKEQVPMTFDFVAEVKGKGKEIDTDVDELMQKDDFEYGAKAALLQPIEKAEEGFQLWESGSDKGDL